MPVGRRIQLPHTPNPGISDNYAVRGRRGRPVLFQFVDPTNRPIFQHLLALHINPSDFDESFSKSKNVVMTFGGFVEFIWPDELDSISCSASTGAFVGPFSGLTAGSEARAQGNFPPDGRSPSGRAAGRQQTMAWERQQDLLDIFRNNGHIYNGRGQPVIRGRLMCIYDRGIYIGSFSNFSVTETDEQSFSFELSWEFQVEDTVYVFPGLNHMGPGQAIGNSSSAGKTSHQKQIENQPTTNSDATINNGIPDGVTAERLAEIRGLS